MLAPISICITACMLAVLGFAEVTQLTSTPSPSPRSPQASNSDCLCM